MKKIRNRINYFVKLFLAVSLLFNNLMPLSTVFADEIDNNVVTENEQVNDSVINNEDNNEKENNLDTTNDTTNDSMVSDETNDTNQNVQNEFSVVIENNQIIIKYTNADELTDEILTVSEDFEYVDKTTYGGLYSQIELSDDVKESLKEGYVIDSEILNENIFDGTYTVEVTIGEENESASLDVVSEENGFEYSLYTEDGTLLTPDDDGRYVVGTDTERLIVVGNLLLGGISPNDTYLFNDEDVALEDLLNGIVIDTIELNGRLYGEFWGIESNTLGKDDNKTEYNEVFGIMYGTYQDNTDVLNESAKNVELDKEYVFYGDTRHGIIYMLDEFNLEDIEKIVEDALVDNEYITYSFDEGILELMDDNGNVVTYTWVYLNDDTKINGKLVNDNEDIASGDEFEVKYVVTLNDYAINGINGLINYDKELLELVSVDSDIFTGNLKDDKYLYLGDSIYGEEVIDDEDKITIQDKEYVVLTLTFKALKAGTSNVTIEDAKFFDYAVYYVTDEDALVEVIINSSDDNSLASLTVAGKSIELNDDTLEYELTVENDVTEPNVEASLTNDNAEIVSVVCPEELQEGENVITIVVRAENGDEKVYTIKVTREEAQKVEPVAYTESSNYQENVIDSTDNDDDKKEVIKDTEDDEDNDEEDEVKDKKDNKVTRMIVIALIALAVVGLIYLIFRDEDSKDKIDKTLDKSFNDKPKKYNGNKGNNFNKTNNPKKGDKKER